MGYQLTLIWLCADLSELQLPSNIGIEFPDGKDKPMHFVITIRPDEGIYRYISAPKAAFMTAAL